MRGRKPRKVIRGITVSTNMTDRVATVGKLLVGIKAGATLGPILSEVIGELIPQQRTDRIVGVIGILADEIDQLGLSIEVLRNLMVAENFVDLFEDAMLQAARALSDERREYIASFLVTSLTTEELEHLQEKRLLSLLSEINDSEVILLKYASISPAQASHEFALLHRKVIGYGLDRNEVDDAIRSSYITHLRNIGLVEDNNTTPDSRFDPQYLRETPLGRILLKYIGL